MLLSLNDGIQNISDTISLLSNKNDYAYFFIVGAGISIPEIPAASSIIEICKDEVKKRGEDVYQIVVKKSAIYETNPSAYYSSWIENAFPNPINRSFFYKSLIKNSKISSANLMLAQILQSKNVTNTVFTTNFDDKIEQALDLIGSKDVFSSENNMDNLVVNVNSDEIQIVHVHGTYRFYDIANLDTEISNISGQTGTISSFQVLRNFLQQKAPIIFGYSGWENDVIMKCLKERLSYPVPYNYIWVCYCKKDYDSLPKWLKENNNVCFLIPSDHSSICDETEKDIENIFNINQEDVSEIPATLFLGKMISQLKIIPPKIFVNPYEYFSNMVKKTLPHNEDVLHLRHWAERMKYFAQEDTEFDIRVKELEVALISKDFDNISKVILSLCQIKIAEGDLKFLINIILSELLEDKYLIKIADSKGKLIHAILDFAKAHYDMLLQGNELNSLLINILSVRFKNSEKVDYSKIIDTIYDLTIGKEKLLEVHLSAIGIKSSMTIDESMKLSFINELLAKLPNCTQNRELKRKELVALLNKSELVDGEEAVTLFTVAKKIFEDFNLNCMELLLLKTKAEITLKIQDKQEQLKWVSECIGELVNYESQECKYEVLNIIKALSANSSECLLKITDFEDIINSLLDSIIRCKCEIENCECTLMVVETYLSLANITQSDKNKLVYCQKILSLGNKFPHECGKYQYNLFSAFAKMSTLPTMLVPDEIKIDYLIKMKDIHNIYEDNEKFFLYTIKVASEMGNKKLYFESDLKDELYKLEAFKTLDKAIEEYRSKSYSEAENLFLSLTETSINEVRDNAFNNLAFMARREEVSEKCPQFSELIEKVSDYNIFKQMNLLLYYLQTDNNDLDKCKENYNTIKNATDEDIDSLVNCWNNESFVGEESEVAMFIINSTKLDKDNLTWSLLSDSQYNLEILKAIIYEG